MTRYLIAATASLILLGGAHAQDDTDEQQRGERRGPPPVALEACASSVQGDPCSFEGRRGETVEGTCETKREDKPLACMPEGGPPKHRLEIS